VVCSVVHLLILPIHSKVAKMVQLPIRDFNQLVDQLILLINSSKISKFRNQNYTLKSVACKENGQKGHLKNLD
jgi:hypothetical protein